MTTQNARDAARSAGRYICHNPLRHLHLGRDRLGQSVLRYENCLPTSPSAARCEPQAIGVGSPESRPSVLGREEEFMDRNRGRPAACPHDAVQSAAAKPLSAGGPNAVSIDQADHDAFARWLSQELRRLEKRYRLPVSRPATGCAADRR